MLDTATGLATEAVVDLDAGSVESAVERPDAQAFPLMEEFGRAEAANPGGCGLAGGDARARDFG